MGGRGVDFVWGGEVKESFLEVITIKTKIET